MVVPHFDSKQLCSLETGATPAKSERSSRFRSLDGCILKAGCVCVCVIPQRQKPAKASHAKGDVCVFLARDQQIVGPSEVPIVCVRSLWLEELAKSVCFFSGYPESLNLQQLEVQRSNGFFHISKVTCQMQDTFCLMSPLPQKNSCEAQSSSRISSGQSTRSALHVTNLRNAGTLKRAETLQWIDAFL